MCHSSLRERRRRTQDKLVFGGSAKPERRKRDGAICFSRYLIQVIEILTLMLIWNLDLMPG